MAPTDTTPLVKKNAEKLPFPLGLVSPGVRPYLELIRFHKVSLYAILTLSSILTACDFRAASLQERS